MSGTSARATFGSNMGPLFEERAVVKHPKRALPCLVIVDRDRGTPLYAQLYEQFRRAIITGQFGGGMRLPASRVLARDLGVSRNTVNNAFAQLVAEGYLN